MALLFMDSFDHYATGDLLEKWTDRIDDACDPAIASGGRTSNCLKWSATSNQSMGQLTITPQHGPTSTTCICGFALKVTPLANFAYGSGSIFFEIRTGSTQQYLVWLNDDGTLSVGKTAIEYTSSGVPVTDNTWTYVEVKVVVANSPNGSVELRVNGTTVLSQTGIDTQQQGTAGWTSVVLLPSHNGAGWGPRFTNVAGTLSVDDFYLLDGSTGTYRANNDFWGDVSIKYMVPNGDASIQWDRTGTGLTYNYDAVKETEPNDDTNFVSTDVVDERDLYDFPSVTSGATIYGVQAVLSAKKGDTGSAQIAAVCKSDTVEEEHPAPLGIASDTAYNYFLFPWNGDPKDQTTWTESRLNAAQFGPKKTA